MMNIEQMQNTINPLMYGSLALALGLLGLGLAAAAIGYAAAYMNGKAMESAARQPEIAKLILSHSQNITFLIEGLGLAVIVVVFAISNMVASKYSTAFSTTKLEKELFQEGEEASADNENEA